MDMAPKRSRWIVVASLAFLPLALALVWVSGYVYWQIRIGRAIAELRRGTGKYTTELFYANPDLLQIGSRGIPRVLGELDLALLRGDEEQAFAFSCGLTDLENGAAEVDGAAAAASGSYARSRPRLTLEEMRALVKEYQENWPEYRDSYAPWWIWWKGHGR